METPGIVGSPPPITFHPGAFKCTMYLNDGTAIFRCGSLASIGNPLSDFAPLIIQLLLPSVS